MMADEIVHEYDPAKRRAYYLKTRQLKGRTKKGVTLKPATKTRAQRQAERRKKLEAEVTALKGRLEKLRKALSVLTEQAKARSGAETKKTPAKKASSAAKSSTKQTAAQKAKAAKASKEYYEKNKDKLLEDEVKSLKAKIKTMQERIEKMRKNGSVGARNTTSKK
ncbi:hypothetical protein SEA_MAYA_13 [Streptomyces phage Maya]|uniref:Uncharacterized protein n=4 Tax=Rimavirus rima TaxID=2560784 RepID=A0A7G9UVX3_9CAUD|nr:hypothetical protein FDH06_gp13 [Streptomyces phage Rima]AOZ64878.1 hypothetical protein SEA_OLYMPICHELADO_13 [Streptomyces phage OlympicHelado]AOZ64967.1 hypothetical protein SEA_RIMA_13 [Streptomyces phage Rima]QNN98178.1 hypothetical protein SEA_MAYA_13 [Streptomyces phage Maya]